MRSIKNSSIIIVFVMAILSCTNNNSNDIVEDKDHEITQSVINPPLPHLNIKLTSYSIDTEKDTVLIYRTGSRITIPKNAFLDAKGNVVTGKVDLVYREFPTAFDAYLGGVPMEYDNDGTAMVFETAGMLEINATSNNEPVYVNPDNKINVDMTSFEQGDRYNLYQLDTKSGKWTDIGKDKVEQTNYDEELAKLPNVPPPPKIAGQFSFTIGDDTGKYPELAMYDNVLFEPVDGNRCGMDVPQYIDVKSLGNGKYEVTFTRWIQNAQNEVKCICYLSFEEGVDYNTALRLFENKYAATNELREKRRKEIETEWENYRKRQADLFSRSSINEKVVRTLQVNRFGFINVDFPTAYPQGATLIASYKDTKGKDLTLRNIVLVEKGRNALFRYTDQIKFDPAKENVLWGITENGSLAYFNSDEFKTVHKTSGKHVFKMTVHDEELRSFEDITDVLFKSRPRY